MQRRTYLGCVTATVATVGLAGCLSDAEESGTVSGTDGVMYNLDVNEGEIIEVEVDNEEGSGTFVDVTDPDGELVADLFVETEDTLSRPC